MGWQKRAILTFFRARSQWLAWSGVAKTGKSVVLRYNSRVLIEFGVLMEQLEFFPIPSPCVGVCTADAKGYCLGCWRSREERLYWLKMSDGQKQTVLRLCRLRARRQQQRPVETAVDAGQISMFGDEM